MAGHGPGGRRPGTAVPQAGVGSVPQLHGLRRPGLHPGLPGSPVARVATGAQRAPGQAGRAVAGQRDRGAGAAGRAQLHRRAPEQALGPDRQPGVQPVGADAEGAPGARFACQAHRLRPGGELRPLPRSARGVHLPGQEPVGGLRRHRPPAGARQGRQRAGRGHDGARVQGPGRTHHQPRRAGHRQRVHQGDHGPGAQGLLHRRPRREGSGQQRSHRVQLGRPGADQRQLRQREAGAGAEAGGARRRDDGGRGRSAHRLLPARKSRRSRPT